MKILILALFLFTTSAFAGFYAKTQTSVTATTTSTKFLNPNGNRNYLILVNNGSVPVIVKFGSVQSASEGISIAAGGYYEPFQTPRESVYMKTASSTASVFILEGVTQL